MLNKVMLIGNVGRDPEVRHLDNGSVVASFSLATSERYKDRNGEYKEQTEWHELVCWRATAEFAEKYVKKGSQIYVEGKIRSRSYNDKDGNNRKATEIYVDSLNLLGRRQDNQTDYTNQRPAAATRQTTSSYQQPHQQSYQQQAPIKQQVPSAPIQIDYEEDGADDLPF